MKELGRSTMAPRANSRSQAAECLLGEALVEGLRGSSSRLRVITARGSRYFLHTNARASSRQVMRQCPGVVGMAVPDGLTKQKWEAGLLAFARAAKARAAGGR